MDTQSYSNHRRYVPGFHFVLLTIILLYLIGAITSLVRSFMYQTGHLLPTLAIISAIIFVFIYGYMRDFAVKVQDRAIRAEENLRHFVLTGKRLDPKLKMSQIVALRFAPDDEFPALAVKASAEDLTNDSIKKAIKNWKADNNRV